MKPAIVKWTVDLYAPGAILSPTLIRWFEKANSFHSRRILWPNLPLEELLDIAEDGSIALQDFCHIRVSAIMDGYGGPTDGELDRLLSLKPMDEVFDLARVAGAALTNSSAYQSGITRASWVELFETDGEIAKYRRSISIQEIAELVNQAPTE